MNTTHTNETAAAILAAARTTTGDFYAARRALARFCTEALADCAAALVIREKFASARVPTWRTLTRDEAVERLCGWVHQQRIESWAAAFEASRTRRAIAAGRDRRAAERPRGAGSGAVSDLRPALFRIAERLRWDAVTASVAADALHPRTGYHWRPMCWLCVDALEVALGGVDVDAYRVNRYSNHDAGCCSFCESAGPDTLVARVSDEVFAAPPDAFLAGRCAYADGGGRLQILRSARYPTRT